MTATSFREDAELEVQQGLDWSSSALLWVSGKIAVNLVRWYLAFFSVFSLRCHQDEWNLNLFEKGPGCRQVVLWKFPRFPYSRDAVLSWKYAKMQRGESVFYLSTRFFNVWSHSEVRWYSRRVLRVRGTRFVVCPSRFQASMFLLMYFMFSFLFIPANADVLSLWLAVDIARCIASSQVASSPFSPAHGLRSIRTFHVIRRRTGIILATPEWMLWAMQQFFHAGEVVNKFNHLADVSVAGSF
jgi:hypothetical protein